MVAKRGRGRPPKLGGGDGGDAAIVATGNKRSPSPARSESPVGGFWDEFPISEFILTLYEPIQRIQWLPRAVADVWKGKALSGFFFTGLVLVKDLGRCSPALSPVKKVGGGSPAG